MEIVVTITAAACIVRIGFVEIESLSVTIAINWFLNFVFVRSPSMSMTTDGSGLVGENRRSLRFYLTPRRLLKEDYQSRTVAYK